MKKRILALVAAMVMVVVSIVSPGQDVSGIKAARTVKPSVKNFAAAIKKEYGQDFAPNLSLKKDEIESRYGIPSSWYKSASAQVPMINVKVDTLIIVKAKNKSTRNKVKAKLNNYKQYLINNTTQYPMNMLKIQASTVYVKGNYVFFIMLGNVDNSVEENGTDQQIINAYKQQNDRAVNVINSFYK